MTTFSMGVATSVGRVRRNQEDASFGMNLSDGIAAGVFDGMGGHEKGQLASDLATRFCRASLKSGAPVSGLLQKAHGYMVRVLGSGPGTTAVVAVFRLDRVWYDWAGDSRLYLYRDGLLTRLTEDHGQNNVVTRCLGGGCDGRGLDEVRCEIPIKAGDVFLLCTDGLTREVPDVAPGRETSLALLLRLGVETGASSQQVADTLIQCADGCGGRDNSTAIVVQVQP